MSLSGRRGAHGTTMLNYKRKRSPLPKTRCTSPIMSVFASMPTKQGQATFPKDQPFSQPIASAPKPPPEEALEEQDKYPCLRRALSCTETPILPLGTYAVEFGFDVSTHPFSPHWRPVFSLPETRDPTPHLDSCRRRLPEPHAPIVKPPCDKSCKLSDSATASNLPCCSLWPCQDTLTRIPSSSAGNSTPDERQSGTGPQSGVQAQAERQSVSVEANRNEPADALYATVWKKDKRAWLWKAGNKTGQPGSQDHYLVAKQFKKDNRTWLWKSSLKKRRTGVDS